jgi:hypothetical protein
LSVLWVVLEFNKKTRVGSLNVAYALEEAAHLVIKPSFPKGLEDWVLHERHVFRLFTPDWVYSIICQVNFGPMIGDQSDFLIGISHIPEVIL